MRLPMPDAIVEYMGEGHLRLQRRPALQSFRTPWGQVCIASRGKVKNLCMDVNEGTGADEHIRALRGSGGLEPP